MESKRGSITKSLSDLGQSLPWFMADATWVIVFTGCGRINESEVTGFWKMKFKALQSYL